MFKKYEEDFSKRMKNCHNVDEREILDAVKIRYEKIKERTSFVRNSCLFLKNIENSTRENIEQTKRNLENIRAGIEEVNRNITKLEMLAADVKTNFSVH